MKLNCSNCHKELDPKNINIATDLAKCEFCGAILKVSDLDIALEQSHMNPPKGSDIEVVNSYSDSIEIILPKKGYTTTLKGVTVFTIFWMVFISIWSWGASQGSVFFALFSIPFWLVGFFMIISIFNSINEVQIITLDREKFVLHKLRPIKPKYLEVQFQDIVAIKMKGLKKSKSVNMSNAFSSSVDSPAIIANNGTQHFFEAATDAEKEWVTIILAGIFNKLSR